MKQKSNLLSRLQRNGVGYIVGGVLLLLVIPLYQIIVLNAQGYLQAQASLGAGQFREYLVWVGSHSVQLFGFRGLLVLAFALLISLPFSLFRVIVAQEIIGRQDIEEDEEEDEEIEEAEEDEGEKESAKYESVKDEKGAEIGEDGMPSFAWRGKGFAVIAAWGGLLGIVLYVLGTAASSIYLAVVSSGFTATSPVPVYYETVARIFSVSTNVVAVGLLSLATLLFGAMIARSGRRLWPGIWVAFGYAALAMAALLSGGAIGSVSGEAPLATPAILLFAAWVLWLGVMLVRLRAE